MASTPPPRDKWRHGVPPSSPTNFRVEGPAPGDLPPLPPPPLWHYTTFDALEGITRTGNLWASKIQFLNDEQEFRHAWDVIIEAVRRRLGATCSEGDGRTMRAILACARDVSKCVVCLSESRDQLSQWRGYGHGAPAVAIAFDRELLADAAASLDHGWKLERCLYSQAEKHAAVAPIADAIVREWPGQEVHDEARFNAVQRAVVKVWNEYMHIAPVLKHDGFREEAEVRLVSMPFPNDGSIWRFRRRDNLAVPYVEFPLAKTGVRNMAIQGVIVGPHPHQESLMSAVQHLLSVRIKPPYWSTTSSIPYR